MKASDPLLDAWTKTVETRSEDAAVLDESGRPIRTFRQIAERADEWAQRLKDFEPHAVVAVQIGNHPEWLSILVAAWTRNLVVLPLDPLISGQDRTVAMDVCRASGLIAIDGNQRRSENDIHSSLQISRVSDRNVTWDGHPPSLLKLTSGTTATPRAVRFRSEQLVADCIQICDTMGITDRDVNFAVIPVSHSYGFSNLLTPLLIRGVPIALSSDRLPRAVIANLHLSRATVFAGMPVWYQAFSELSDIPELSNLRLCISAGAPLPLSVATRFREKFPLPIHSFYGSSECGGICYDRDANSDDEGFVGPAMDGVRIEKIENSSASQIRVHSRAVGDGYFPESDKENLGNGVFVPDDLLTDSGRGWKVVGRRSDLINVAGKKVNPAEVEAELLSARGVRQAVVFGRKSSLRHQEVAACVVGDSDLSESELLKACRQRLSGWQVPKRIFVVDQLPVNERGKISRRDLGIRFADK